MEIGTKIQGFLNKTYPLVDDERRAFSIQKHGTIFWKCIVNVDTDDSPLLIAALEGIVPSQTEKSCETLNKLLNNKENGFPFCSATYRQGFDHVIVVTFSPNIF